MEVLSKLQLAAAIVSVLLAGAGTIPYIVSILMGKTKPPYSTYIGWTLVGFTMLVFQYYSIDEGGSMVSMMGVAAFALIPLCVLVTMIKAQVPWTWETRDKFVYLGLGVCWTLYVVLRLTGSSELAIAPMIILALTDGFTCWPIFQDSLRGLQSSRLERAAWIATALSAIAELLSVGNWWTAEMFIPGYLAVYMCSIALASILRSPAEEASAHASATPAE